MTKKLYLKSGTMLAALASCAPTFCSTVGGRISRSPERFLGSFFEALSLAKDKASKKLELNENRLLRS